MMVVGAVQHFGMQCYSGIHREGLEPLLHKLGVERADLVAHELGLEDQKRSTGNVDRNPRQRLVHWYVHVGISRDALHIAECLLDGLAERDADIFGGMVMIDVQVAFGLDRDVDARVPRKQVEHVVEEPMPVAIDARPAPSRSISISTSVSLVLRLTAPLRMANILCSRAFYQGFAGFATALRTVCKYGSP